MSSNDRKVINLFVPIDVVINRSKILAAKLGRPLNFPTLHDFLMRHRHVLAGLVLIVTFVEALGVAVIAEQGQAGRKIADGVATDLEAGLDPAHLGVDPISPLFVADPGRAVGDQLHGQFREQRPKFNPGDDSQSPAQANPRDDQLGPRRDLIIVGQVVSDVALDRQPQAIEVFVHFAAVAGAGLLHLAGIVQV